MSETEKPAEVLLSTAANGAGPPENTGDGTVPETIGGQENGIKTAAAEAAEETGLHEQKDEDVRMMDVADVKVGEQNDEGNGEEVVPMKVDGGEGETEEPKDGQGTKEESEVAMEKQKRSDEKTEDAGGKNDGAAGKSELGNDEKGEEFEEKGEEIEEKDEQTEKGEEAEVKGDGAEEKSEESNGEKTEEEEGRRKKGRRGHKVREKGQGKENKQRGKTKEALRTPTTSSIDRPVRERKTVERLVEIVEKGPSKAFLIEKGRGTPLKDIPNVAYKLSKKRPADIRSLHLLLFGRKGKAINFKSHIFQFSGFVWHENEDKQRFKVKEKLDKCVKDKLLDLCDVFDIPVSRATSRKEDLVAKLLDFMVAPHATTDVILAEKEQSAKSRKRKRGSRRSALRRCVGISVKQSRKKRIKSESTSRSEKSTIETEDEDEDGDAGEQDKVNGLPDEDEAIKHCESGEGEESEHDNTEKEIEYSAKGRQDTKKLLKKQGSPATAKSKKVTTPKRTPQPTSTKSRKKPSSKCFKANEAKDSKEEVFSRKKKNIVTPKKKMPSSNSDMGEKKTTGKKAGSKAKSDQAEKSGPTDEELRKTICEILKEVDFNTATFTDILKKLASSYEMDLTARKASIKLMIQDELTKLADEAEEDEDDDGEGEGDTEKVENSEPAGKEVEA